MPLDSLGCLCFTLSHVPRAYSGKQAPGGLAGKWSQATHAINHSPPPPLVLVSPLAAAATGPGGCDTIYQGFAECLIRLGDSMGLGGELETVCR